MNILQVATLYSWIVVVTLMGGFAGIFALMWFFTRHISKTILFSNLAILGGFILFHMAFLYHHSIDAPGDVITDGYINNRVIITYYLFLFSFSYFFLKSRFLLGYKILCTVLVFLLGFASLIAGLYAFPMIIFFHFFLIIFIL